MSQFEDNLWGVRVDRHGEDLARAGAPVATQTRRTRVPLLAGTTGGLAATVAAVVLLAGSAASPSPAFALTVRKQSVSVTIHTQSGIAAANRKLGAMGMQQRLTNVKIGHTITLSCLAPGVGSDGQTVTFAGVPNGYSSAGAPAAGTTWHVVDCSSLTGTGTTGNTGAG